MTQWVNITMFKEHLSPITVVYPVQWSIYLILCRRRTEDGPIAKLSD